MPRGVHRAFNCADRISSHSCGLLRPSPHRLSIWWQQLVDSLSGQRPRELSDSKELRISCRFRVSGVPRVSPRVWNLNTRGKRYKKVELHNDRECYLIDHSSMFGPYMYTCAIVSRASARNCAKAGGAGQGCTLREDRDPRDRRIFSLRRYKIRARQIVYLAQMVTFPTRGRREDKGGASFREANSVRYEKHLAQDDGRVREPRNKMCTGK